MMAKESYNHSYKNSKRTRSVDDDDDYVDPRVQVELEQLNNATDAINRLEVKLDEARAAYRHLLCESSQRFKYLAAKLGNCIEKAQPYYEARLRAKEAHLETQRAALNFERANSAHGAAKEMVFHAEEGLMKEGMTFDPTWQEMLNHATKKVNDAERERTLSKHEHRVKSQIYSEKEEQVKILQKELKRVIAKSKPYYEMKARFNQLMEEQKNQVQKLEKEILRVKQSYSMALRNLEEISIEIHQQRQQKQQRQALGSRGTGVGAESPAPPPQDRTNLENDADFDDVYLRIPVLMTTKKNSATCSSGGSIQSPTEVESNGKIQNGKEITRVDNACQTDNLENPMSLLSDHKSHSDRVSAWVQESGLRMLAVARNASLLPGSDAVQAGNLAAMLLNATEENDRSDVESLNSTDVLTDEQIASLMLDKELDDAYPEIAINNKSGDKEKDYKLTEVELNDLLRKCTRSGIRTPARNEVLRRLNSIENSTLNCGKSSEEKSPSSSSQPCLQSDIQTPDSTRSDCSSLSNVPSSPNPDPSSSSSEIKVVAVQFTVQETVVTPKLSAKHNKSHLLKKDDDNKPKTSSV